MSTNKYFKQIDYMDELMHKKKWEAGVKRDFRTLAKYLFNKNNTLTPTMLYKEIVDVCNKKGKAWFNESLDFRLIDKCVNEARKLDNPIIQIESIAITESEWNFINNTELDLTQKERKILFGMLVHAKLKVERLKLQNAELNGKYYFGGNSKHSYKQLLESLNDKYTRTFLDKDIHLIVKNFNELGLVKTYYNTAVELLFMENVEDSNVKFEIYNFDVIGLYWEYEFDNPKVKNCEECGTYIYVNGKYKNYCCKCSKVILQKQKNEWKKNNWKKSLNT